MEIFPGGLLERVETGEVGPTFSCLIRRQFEALRAGDRFFFTHSNTGGCHEFSRSQRQNLMRRTLRDVICDNTEVERLQKRVMERWGKPGSNWPKPCFHSHFHLDVGNLLLSA